MKDNGDDSLRKILTATEISEKFIMKATTLISDEFGTLGYNKGEKAEDYPHINKTGIDNFMYEISTRCDNVALDMHRNDHFVFSNSVCNRHREFCRAIEGTRTKAVVQIRLLQTMSFSQA